MNGLGIALARPPLAEALMRQGKLVSVDPRTALNPSSYWLDRPWGEMRAAAKSLARRIAGEARVGQAEITRFISATR